jgi:1,2-diacylglycerol 3-beta-galactosyltransferase
MRIAATASATALLALSSQVSASNHKFTFATQVSQFGLGPEPHLTVPYGGDAPSATTSPETNEHAASSIENTKEQSACSNLLNSVSAGGAFHSDAAFVGTKTRVPLTRTPPFGSGESYRDETSLSIATNQQQETDAIADTSSDDETSTVAPAKPLRASPKNNGPLKILFLSSDTGGGHRASAEALANQFQRLYPGTTYDLFDVWTDVETSWPY